MIREHCLGKVISMRPPKTHGLSMLFLAILYVLNHITSLLKSLQKFLLHLKQNPGSLLCPQGPARSSPAYHAHVISLLHLII